jgi:hypothetical protein
MHYAESTTQSVEWYCSFQNIISYNETGTSQKKIITESTFERPNNRKGYAGRFLVELIVTGFWDDCTEVSEFLTNRNFLNRRTKTSVDVTLVTQKDEPTRDLLL